MNSPGARRGGRLALPLVLGRRPVRDRHRNRRRAEESLIARSEPDAAHLVRIGFACDRLGRVGHPAGCRGVLWGPRPRPGSGRRGAVAGGPARPRADRRHGLQLRPDQRGRRNGGRRTTFRTAGAGGWGCTKKAASATRCRRSTSSSSFSTSIWMRPVSAMRIRPPSSAPRSAAPEF
jgi:hypothetical protein